MMRENIDSKQVMNQKSKPVVQISLSFAESMIEAQKYKDE